MNTFSRSFALVKSSWHVLRQDKELMALPVLATVASILLTLPLLGAAFVGFSSGNVAQSSAATDTTTTLGAGDIVGLILLGLAYFVGAYVVIFFQAALVLAANERMSGGNPTLSTALAAAWENKGRVASWALISATVSLVLQAVQEKAGFIGRLVVGALGLAWALVTIMVLPVLVIEKVGVKEAFTKSADAFKRTWGESMVGNGGIGLVSFLLGLAVVAVSLPFILLGANGSNGLLLGLGIVILIVGILAVSIFSAALNGVFRTALYRYAILGDEFGGFTHEQISGAFKPKKG